LKTGATPPSTAQPTAVQWRVIGRRLTYAAARLHSAHVAVEAEVERHWSPTWPLFELLWKGLKPPHSTLAELALDLEHQAQALASRASLLGESTTEPKQAGGGPEVEELGVVRLLESASRKVAAARKVLAEVANPDVVTNVFEAELVVLSEMLLSLRQQAVMPELAGADGESPGEPSS
jgi:hypothetical protein